jgi:hypothetical protein
MDIKYFLFSKLIQKESLIVILKPNNTFNTNEIKFTVFANDENYKKIIELPIGIEFSLIILPNTDFYAEKIEK